MSSLDLFHGFLIEALDYHRIYNPRIYIQVFSGREGAGIIFSQSDRNSIYILFGEDTPLDYQLLIKLAWHEIAHLIDKLEGWPYTLSQETMENGIEQIREYFPGKLAYGNCHNLINGLENVISDISVIKRIIKTPAKTPSLISMIKIIQNTPHLREHTKPEKLRRTIAIAMEMQYLNTNSIDNLSKEFQKLESTQLEIIYKNYPEYHTTYTKLTNIFKKIHFTTNEKQKMQWIIEACKTVPEESVFELSQVYANSNWI